MPDNLVLRPTILDHLKEFVPFDHKVSDSNEAFFSKQHLAHVQKGTSTYKRKENANSMKKTGDKEQCSRIANRAPPHYLQSRADQN